MAKSLGANDTIIGQGVTVEGDLKSDHDIWINGKVVGSVKAGGTVTIAADGDVKANVQAQTVILAGKLKGKITAQDAVNIHETAKLDGDIETKSLMVANGARLNGKVAMHQDKPRANKTEG